MTAPELYTCMQTQDEYHTAGPPPRPRWGCGLRIQGRAFREIWGANRMARAGCWPLDQIALSSLRILATIERCGGRLHVTGLRHLAELRGGAVLVANHISTLETLLLPGLVSPHHGLSFVVKESLLKYPIFGAVLTAQHPVAVTRRRAREDYERVLTDGTRLTAMGRVVAIFPQSTRSFMFDPAKFSSIGAKLARHAGVPLIPLALRTDLWGQGRWVKDLGPVDITRELHFAFGPPVVVADDRTAHQQALAFIREQLTQWGVPVAGQPAATPP